MQLSSLLRFTWKRDGDEDSRLSQPLLSDAELREIFLSNQHNSRERQLPDLAGSRSGDARSVHRGYGLDYEESRAYLPGDETRFMNWRLSARTGDLQMKVFREERKPGAVLLIDRRNSMRFGTRARLKLTQALQAAALLCADAHQSNFTVTTLLQESQLRLSEAESSEQGILNLLSEAAMAAPPMHRDDTSADLLEALDLLAEKRVPGSTIYLLSDFIDLSELHRNRLTEIASDCRLFALLFYDPVEYQLPTAGKLRFSGTKGPVDLDTSDSRLQARYKVMAQDHFNHRSSLLRELGIPCQLISTTEEDLQLEALL